MNKQFFKDRIIKNCIKDSKTGCWNWSGVKDKNDYGLFIMNAPFKKTYRVHRLAAYIWLDFDLKSRLHVCHHCDNEKCFNPEHLFIGTHKDNMDDMYRKNRGPKKNGENNGNAKLTEDDVFSIRRLSKIQIEYAITYRPFTKRIKRKYTDEKIAKIFGVCRPSISDILRGKSWKNYESEQLA